MKRFLRHTGRKLRIGRAILWLQEAQSLRLMKHLEMILAKRRCHALARQLVPIPAGRRDIEVHMLLEHDRVCEGILAFYSFAHFANRDSFLVVHDDGTLISSDLNRLKSVFPCCEVLSRAESDEVVNKRLREKGLKFCAELRRTHAFGLKFFDPLVLGKNGNVVLIDSDVLFFAEPRELVDAVTTLNGSRPSVFIRDIVCQHCLPCETLTSMLGQDCIERLNAGLLGVQRSRVDLARVERALQHQGFWDEERRARFYAEQTLWAMELSLAGAQPLPETYALHAAGVPEESAVSIHYCGGMVARYRYYVRGVPYLFKKVKNGGAQKL